MSQLLRGTIQPFGGTHTRRARRLGWRDAVAVWCERGYLIGALVSFLAAVAPHLDGFWVVSDVLSLVNVPSEPSLFVIAVLLVLGGGLRRRLRAAHTVVVLLALVNVLSYAALAVHAINEPEAFAQRVHIHGVMHQYLLFRGSATFNLVAFGLSLGALVLLSRARGVFRGRLAPGNSRAAVAVLVGGLAASGAITAGLTSAFPGSLDSPREIIVWSLRSTVGISTPPDTPGFRGDLGHDWIYSLAGLLSTAAFVLTALVFWRSGHGNPTQTATDELAVRRLLLQFGEDDSLGYFATRRDKSVIFSDDGRAALTYRMHGAISVASADPIGTADAWAAAIRAWLDQCREQGQYAAVLGSSEAATKLYVAAGLRALTLGDEAIIDIDGFSLRGRAMRQVRQAVSRISRAGYTYEVRRHSDLSAPELATIADLAERWRGDETERGFSMALSRLGDPADGRCLLITARDADGRIRGFLSFVPWGVRGLSLDLMRRDRDAENGLNEYLVASMIEAAPAHGVRRISLNFAVFRTVFSSAEQVGAGPIMRITDAFLSFASRFYQLETLYRSNDKYRPAWVPRFVCYDPALTVARAGIAMGIAEGFLPPLGPKFLVGARPGQDQPPRVEHDFVEQVRRQEDQLLLPRPPVARLSEQQQVRRRKLQLMESAGRPGYPVSVRRSDSIGDVRSRWSRVSAGEVTGHEVSVCGRVRAIRDFGGVSFATLEDVDDRIQVLVVKGSTPPAERSDWRAFLDLGDYVSVTGPVAASRRGELSVLMTSWQMAAKCLTPMPHLHARLSDDVRVSARSLDLVVNPSARRLLERRSVGIQALREAMRSEGFSEVETPMLQMVHGGATARPFRTHINAYNTDLYLRIAPELYLKRLSVGGMQRIFEIGRNFRNEGVDATHNPEFTSMEAYAAFGDYVTMRELTAKVIRQVAQAVNGAPVALRPDGAVVDLSGCWPVVTVHEAVSRAVGATLTCDTSREKIAAVCVGHQIPVPPRATAGELICQLYDDLVEKHTVFPTFYTDFPVETSPLTRTHRDDSRLAERWDLVAFGAEIGTAYSELTDAIDQRRRLVAQSMAAAAGDLEAMQVDEAFLGALELGLPPTGGLGIGVDRLVMMLTGGNIRTTLTFPFVRPQEDR